MRCFGVWQLLALCFVLPVSATFLDAKEQGGQMVRSSTLTEVMTGVDAALSSPQLEAVRRAMTPVLTRKDVGVMSGSRRLTKASDEKAIGKALLQVAVFSVSDAAAPEASVARALEETAVSLQLQAIEDTPVSYPKDAPNASARALDLSEDWSSLMLSWTPEEGDQDILSEVTATLRNAVAHASGLEVFALESTSWTFQRAGVAVVDPSTNEAVWYSYRTVRALAGRR